MDFLAENNPAGMNALRLVARGNAIIAELLRLSEHIPPVFTLSQPEDKAKYGPIIFGFEYLKKSEAIEDKITNNRALVEVDEEFRENHMDILSRFYKMFESIYKYYEDFNRYLDDLRTGVYIQQSIEGVLKNVDGKQLLAEALYLYGVVLMLLDIRIRGVIRERMLVSFYRYQRAKDIPHIDEVCKLCAQTGLMEGKKPKGYPEEYFARFPVSESIVSMVIGRLRSDDIYSQLANYPLPAHRSTAFATQASMLYIILYFAPDVLRKEQATMREIVDKHFSDNWVISYYMGFTVDLSIQWDGYRAAKEALNNIVTTPMVRQFQEHHLHQVGVCIDELHQLLTEGVLEEEFVMQNIPRILNVTRDCNVTIRWLMLHTTTGNKKLREIVVPGVDADRLLRLLLDTAQFEFKVKRIIESLLDAKSSRWDECRSNATANMNELSEYFSGEKALSKVKKNEQLQAWFSELSTSISVLNFNDATSAGRKIQQMMRALEEVEQFHQIESSLQIKEFLANTRDYLMQMLYYVNVQEEVMVTLSVISDMSYAWGIMNDYVQLMQRRIKQDAGTVIKLRATFLKLASILDLPLIRILQANSPDLISVSEYYSGELVTYVRRVLDIIPKSMFTILDRIINLQTNSLKEMPAKVEKDQLKNYAQLDMRFELASLTHKISVFTEGILAMETTLVGVIKVNPKELLEDGVRKELVRQIASYLDRIIRFKPGKRELMQNLRVLEASLDGFRRSFEYIQDYVNIYGLKIWQEEFSRIINYSVEQECNSFLKRKVYWWNSDYQNEAIPIPHFPPIDSSSVGCVGRLAREVIEMTTPATTTYVDQMAAWYDVKGIEVVGIRTFSQMLKSISVYGLSGVDRLYSFMVVSHLRRFVGAYRQWMTKDLKMFASKFDQALSPSSTLPQYGKSFDKFYGGVVNKLSKLWPLFLDTVLKVGQCQLLRRGIAYELSFAAKIDSCTLNAVLDSFNESLLTDVREHYRSPDTKPYPEDTPIIAELSRFLDSCGKSGPFSKIYVTCEQLDHLALLLFLFVLNELPKFEYDSQIGTLTMKKKGKNAADGVPFVVGVVTMLKQVHSSHTSTFLSYLGQYIRGAINAGVSTKGKNSSEYNAMTLNCLVFLELFTRFSEVPRKTVEGFLPPYIFDQFLR